MKITVQDFQTIWDIAVQYTGSIDTVNDILLHNKKNEYTLEVGEIIDIPFVVNQSIVDYFASKSIAIATSSEALDTAEFEPPIFGVLVNVNGNEIGRTTSNNFIDVNVTDGTNPVNPDSVSLVYNALTIATPKDLELLIPYSSGDTSAEFTIISGSNGTITTADTTGLTSVTYEVNAVTATLPLILAVSDVLTINFDAAGPDGVINLNGSYA